MNYEEYKNLKPNFAPENECLYKGKKPSKKDIERMKEIIKTNRLIKEEFDNIR